MNLTTRRSTTVGRESSGRMAMKIGKTLTGYRTLERPTNACTDVRARLLEECGDQLWVGADHCLGVDEIRLLIHVLQHWVDVGRLMDRIADEYHPTATEIDFHGE